MLNQSDATDLATRVVTAIEGVATAYARRLDRDGYDAILPSECDPAPKAARSEPPAGTPTGPRNSDGSFDEPVQRIVWMSPSDPRDGVTYRLAHAVDGSLVLISVRDTAADEPTVFYDSAPKKRFTFYDANPAPTPAPRVTYAEPASPSAPTPPTA